MTVMVMAMATATATVMAMAMAMATEKLCYARLVAIVHFLMLI